MLTKQKYLKDVFSPTKVDAVNKKNFLARTIRDKKSILLFLPLKLQKQIFQKATLWFKIKIYSSNKCQSSKTLSLRKLKFLSKVTLSFPPFSSI